MGTGTVWGGASQSPFLEDEIGVKVDLRRLDRFVTEPEGDDGAIDTGLE